MCNLICHTNVCDTGLKRIHVGHKLLGQKNSITDQGLTTSYSAGHVCIKGLTRKATTFSVAMSKSVI